jgi:hypothetical protein
MDAVVGMGIDLSRFDSKGVGLIDALSFLYAGNAVYDGELHPHNSYIDLKFGISRPTCTCSPIWERAKTIWQ